MGQRTATALDETETDAFLEGQSTGTLSLAQDDDSYAVPLAYTYAPESRDFYFRLGYGPGSLKREYVDSTERATFVVDARTDEGWKSVVARGRLEHRNTVDDLSTTAPRGSVAEADRELQIPFYHVEPPGEVVYALVRLDTDEVTGVVTGSGE